MLRTEKMIESMTRFHKFQIQIQNLRWHIPFQHQPNTFGKVLSISYEMTGCTLHIDNPVKKKNNNKFLLEFRQPPERCNRNSNLIKKSFEQLVADITISIGGECLK